MDDFADDEVFGGDIDADQIGEKPRSTEFTPWHRPRKHWIRSKQWWSEVNNLRKDPAHRLDSYFNVLSLPGGELLDIRYFYSQLAASDDESNVKKLRLVGFVNNHDDFVEAQRNLPLIGISSPESNEALIKPDNIDDLANNSVVFRTFKNRGPFAVVNLDYCNSIAPPGNENRIASIFQILRYQYEYQPKPWVFMFTTRTAKGAVCENFFRRVFAIINKNITDSEQFTDKFFDHFSECMSVHNEGEDEFSLKPQEECEDYFSQLFVLGFLKWVITSAVERGVKIKLKSVVRYDVEGDDADFDMFSLVLWFQKVGLRGEDRQGIVNVDDDDGGVEAEEVIASRFVSKLKRVKSVEDMLFTDSQSYKAVASDLADFLEECGKCVHTFWDEVCRPEVEGRGWSIDDIRA